MSIKTRKIEMHWNYLLAIESDLDRLSRYVEFDEKNFDCFSIEIARILLASAADVDVVCKQICRNLNPKSSAVTINKYREEIRAACPNIPGFEVRLRRWGLTLTPWDEWKKPRGVPFWWTAYNKIKHHRDSDYQSANLKNALNAVAGLFVMVLYLYKKKAERGQLLPSPQVLSVGETPLGSAVIGDYERGIVYLL